MAINGKTTVPIGECAHSVNVIFQTAMQRFEIVVPILSEKSFEVTDFLYGRRIKTIVFVNESGQEFTAYDCICTGKVIRMDEITLSGQYETLLKGRNIPKEGRISFHFEGLDDYFDDESEFQNFGLSEDNEWFLLNEGESIEVAAKLNGIEGIEPLIALLVRVREYFEFLTDREIYIDRVVYSGKPDVSVEILNDRSLMSKNECLFDKKSRHKPQEVAEGIKQWLAHYEPYKEVFQIWRKTIYNRYISVEDVFIWRCQSLELLCTLCNPLFEEAKRRIRNPQKQQFPNLSNFLEALNAKNKFINCDNTYFDEVKDVRNVYTHYNPERHISERKWQNAFHMVENALNAAVGYVIGLDIKNTGFFFLVPTGTMETRRR